MKYTSIEIMTGLVARIMSHTPRYVSKHVGAGVLASNHARRRVLASTHRLDTPSLRHVPCPSWDLQALH